MGKLKVSKLEKAARAYVDRVNDDDEFIDFAVHDFMAGASWLERKLRARVKYLNGSQRRTILLELNEALGKMSRI
jgi:hypothetical protein